MVLVNLALFLMPNKSHSRQSDVDSKLPPIGVDTTNLQMQSFNFNSNLIPLDYNLKVQSPQAAALAKFSDSPIDHTSGTVSLSIPIYEISLPGLTVPVRLDYSASGIKVDEVASNVGIGWVLNAGGMISRSTVNRPDMGSFRAFPDNPSTFFPNNVFTFDDAYPGGNQTPYEWLKLNLEGCIDFEPDFYSFSFLGKSGKLMDFQSGNFIPYPYQRTVFTGNTAKDEFGNIYIFDVVEGSNSTNNCPQPGLTGCPIVGGSETRFLSRIVTANRDTVNFEYLNESYNYAHSVVESRYRTITTGQGCTTSEQLDEMCIAYNNVNAKVLSKITSNRGHEISFKFKQSNRTDLAGSKALDSVLVKYEGVTIKKAKLHTGYFSAGISSKFGLNFPAEIGYRLKLDSVRMDDELYVFQYNPGLPARLHFGQDFYGYFNGLDPATMIPTLSTPVVYSGANRSSSESHTAMGMLNRVIYPTGGSTTFAYELNPGMGGLRLKEVNMYTDTGILAINKLYSYAGAFQIGMLGSHSFYQTKTQRQSPIDQWPFSLVCDYAVLSNQASDFYSVWPRTVRYSQVTETVQQGDTSGKTVYHFTSPQNIQDRPSDFTVQADNSVYTGLPLKTEYYAKTGSAFHIINLDSTVYKVYYDGTLNSNSQQRFTKVLKATLRESEIEETMFNPFYPARFDYFFYDYFSALLAPIKKISKTFHPDPSNNTFTSTLSELSHDPVYATLLEETFQDVDGKVYSRKFRYPYQFSSSVYQEMTSNNMVGIPLMQLDFLDGNAFSGVMKPVMKSGERYLASGIFMFEPASPLAYTFPTISPNQSLANWRQQVSDTQYDGYGNLTGFSENGVGKVIRYDHKGLLPVLEATNTTTADVAYTSFETNEKGGWTYSGTPTNLNDAMTGSRVYPFTAGTNITRSVSASSATPFVVSFWAKSFSGAGTVTANGTTTAINSSSWQFVTRTITTSGTLTISGSNAMIDDLRLHPLNAQIKTYTHRPLVGISSVTEADGTVQRFQYDANRRLWRIFDDKGNILSQYEYRYKSGPLL